MTVRMASDFFKPRVAPKAPSTPAAPLGGSAPNVAAAADAQAAYQQTNAYLDQWLGTSKPAATPEPTPAPASPEPVAAGSGPMITNGAAGGSVKQLQERLKELGFDPGPIDGDFGPKTRAAVIAFQTDRGIRIDGIVGPETWGKLGVHITVAAPMPEEQSNELVDMGPGKPKAVRRFGELIGVNIAPKFDEMVAAAARDGVELRIKSGYRTHAEQTELWHRYGRDTARVARPGTSNHEHGDAIDFKNLPGAWAWLKRNANRFGFKNYDPEPWHYSLTGN
jgi:hypothetical protein